MQATQVQVQRVQIQLLARLLRKANDTLADAMLNGDHATIVAAIAHRDAVQRAYTTLASR